MLPVKATSTFKVSTTSGTAVISARIISHDGYNVIKTVNQNIDHDSPYYVYFTHPLNGTVATDVPFAISLKDHWGNRIDDRKQVIARGYSYSQSSCSWSGPG